MRRGARSQWLRGAWLRAVRLWGSWLRLRFLRALPYSLPRRQPPAPHPAVCELVFDPGASECTQRSIYLDSSHILRDGAVVEHIGFTLLGLGFWAFLAISAVAGIV